MTHTIRLPLPTGKYSVGMASHSLIDHSRTDLFATISSQRREVTLQIWYPAATLPSAQSLSGKIVLPWASLVCPPVEMANSHYAQFFEDIANRVQAVAETWGFPKEIGQVETQSYPYAPVARTGSSYPVVLFSHGYGGYISQMAYLMEELASHGYVVVAVGHTHDGFLTVFPDGRMIARDDNHPVLKADAVDGERMLPVFEEIKNSTSSLFRQRRLSELYVDGEIHNLLPTQRRLIQQRRDDLVFVIDELYRLNADESWFLKDLLDLNHLAALGYSMGGEAVSELCVMEQRVRVGCAIDSVLWGYLLGRSITQPFFCIFAENGERQVQPETHIPAIIIANTTHGSFSSSAVWWEWLGNTDRVGTISVTRCHQITKHYILAYLNHHLYSLSDAILEETTSIYPEVTYLHSPLA